MRVVPRLSGRTAGPGAALGQLDQERRRASHDPGNHCRLSNAPGLGQAPRSAPPPRQGGHCGDAERIRRSGNQQRYRDSCTGDDSHDSHRGTPRGASKPDPVRTGDQLQSVLPDVPYRQAGGPGRHSPDSETGRMSTFIRATRYPGRSAWSRSPWPCGLVKKCSWLFCAPARERRAEVLPTCKTNRLTLVAWLTQLPYAPMLRPSMRLMSPRTMAARDRRRSAVRCWRPPSGGSGRRGDAAGRAAHGHRPALTA